MTLESSTVEHLSVAMTTTPDDVTQTTVGSDSSSSWSPTAEYYFQCAVIAITLVGTAANGLILYSLIATKQFKKHVLIVNQNALDLAGCLLILITYIMKLCQVYLIGSVGYWLCMIILSENALWCPIVGSTINLGTISIERYLKVVHHIWSKKRLRKWMIYVAGAFSWIGGTVASAGVIIPTTDVVDGVCLSQLFWKSQAAKMAYGIWYFLSFYVIILLIFILCYWRILITIRRQAAVMASHSGPGPSTAQTQSNQIQSNVIKTAAKLSRHPALWFITNVIKTMIFVSAFFAITWAPMDIYYLMMMLSSNLTILQSGYYAALFISMLYICTNPFIYAIKFEPVKRYLSALIPCKKISEQSAEINTSSGTRATRGSTIQRRTADSKV